jgi:hypothetical protein
MIKKKRTDKIEIDLTGPSGNVFSLIGTARMIAKDLNRALGEQKYDAKAIADDMMSDDYEHAIDVLEKHFGEFIILYR